MIIERTTPTKENQFDGTSSAHDSSPLSTDVNFFNSLIAPSSFPHKETNHTSPKNAISELSDKLDVLTKSMTKSLRALSERGRIDEARKYPGHLSDAVLLTHIAVKSIGKSAQCVDKICNLQ